MQLAEFRISDHPPLNLVEVSGLSELVVFAGPNGVGKSRLMQQMLAAFAHPGEGRGDLVLRATCPEERDQWGTDCIKTEDSAHAQLLASMFVKRQARGHWRSGVLNFNSDRHFAKVSKVDPRWQHSDPFTEQIRPHLTLQTVQNRWTDTHNALVRILHGQRDQMADDVLAALARDDATMPLIYEDPFAPFKAAFCRLLPGKSLIPPDVEQQQIRFEMNGCGYRFDDLSSGEREVVRIVFDFILRDPSDCIILFDEPELHLHPELCSRMIDTLRLVGKRNQFLLSTHSSALISESLTDTVVLLSPCHVEGQNQARSISATPENQTFLRSLGYSIGVLSIGKRIVLIEGLDSSADVQAYRAILGDECSEIALAPIGGRDMLEGFASNALPILDKTVWGLEFFVLADGDTRPIETNDDRVVCLPRYHLENYFLDANTLARCLSRLEPSGSWYADPAALEAKLQEIAKGQLSHAVALAASAEMRIATGNVSLMPKGCHQMNCSELSDALREQAVTECHRVQSVLSSDQVAAVVSRLHESYSCALDDADEWKKIIPGKPIFNTLANQVKLSPYRLRSLYISEALNAETGVFAEIAEVFKRFCKRN